MFSLDSIAINVCRTRRLVFNMSDVVYLICAGKRKRGELIVDATSMFIFLTFLEAALAADDGVKKGSAWVK